MNKFACADGEISLPQDSWVDSEDDLRGLTIVQVPLYELMAEASEEGFFASWIYDNEFLLWSVLVEPCTRDIGYGLCGLSVELEERIRAMSERLGGWIQFETRPEFIPIADWPALYAIWRSAQNSRTNPRPV